MVTSAKPKAGDPPPDPATPPAGDDDPMTRGEVKGLISEVLTDFFGEGDPVADPTDPPAPVTTSPRSVEEHAAALVERAVAKLMPKSTPSPTATPSPEKAAEAVPLEGGKFQRTAAKFFGWGGE
jgi:hypothetical protein